MLRRLTPLLTIVLIIASGSMAVAAQGTPVPVADSALAGLGYPELRIVVTDEGSEVPAEVPAGRLLIVLDNQGTPDGPAAVSDVNLLQLPDGVTLEEANAVFAGQGGEAPAWLAELDSAGGFNTAAGKTGYGVVDLEPGEWYIGVGDFNPYTLLTVTGDAPAATEDPPADLSLDAHEYTLGLPEQLPAGPQVWHVANTGEQLHEIQLIRTPELLDVETVITIMTLPEGATPPAGVPALSDLEFVPEGAKTMSPDREIWIEMDLQPGSYVAICSNGDTETGQPHAALGEIHIFTVGEGATPAG
jgi:hypothetical protein